MLPASPLDTEAMTGIIVEWRSSQPARKGAMISATPVPLPSFLREQTEGTLLLIKLQPRASKNEIGAPLGNELKIKVTAPPVDAAANQALIEFLAKRLGCSRSKVELIRGYTSRHKTLLLHGVKPAEALKAL